MTCAKCPTPHLCFDLNICLNDPNSRSYYVRHGRPARRADDEVFWKEKAADIAFATYMYAVADYVYTATQQPETHQLGIFGLLPMWYSSEIDLSSEGE